MKILQLCLRIPFPPNDGGNIAMYNMARSLSEMGCEVQMLAFNTKKHFVDLTNIDESFIKNFKLQAVYLDASVKLFPAFLNLLSSKSYNIQRFISKDFEAKLTAILQSQNFDVVILESLFMAPYIDIIKKHSKAKIVLRAHNVEHIIWHRLYQSEKSSIKKWYLKLLSTRLKKFEETACKKFDLILCLTPDDEIIFKQFCGTVPIKVAPIGLNVEEYQKAEKLKSTPTLPLKLFHLGSMDWMPNIEAIDWFIDYVWTELEKQNLPIELHLAGKAMPDRIFLNANDCLKIVGKVDNANEFISDKQIMIVPLHSGSGMRVKIIEGLAAGKCIISTSIGAEGIKYTDKINILIADTPQQFIAAIKLLINQPHLIIEIGNNARQLATEVYDNKVIAKLVLEYLVGIDSSSLSTLFKN